ncbi:MJ0042-type zinc finger domain-containing protein [uncultured Roseibium sp.]|uniref:MJ0042-type zinc finger domain-containing protein n=1 Tax=uncultured Roseibium sp. TaxID=1936171 RepID=UPI002612A83F|nr:MJ0042-type zinc finger domain-containing protein [uncultured Roseibium sp.]
MKIKCPDCSTSYEIKSEALGTDGRSVKCAKCGNRWFAKPEEEEEGNVDFEAANGTTGTTGVSVNSSPTEDKDEADWAKDAEEDAPSEDSSEEEALSEPDIEDEEETDNFPEPVSDPSGGSDEDRFAADLNEDSSDQDPSANADIESSAKRPKIIVNPNKFRRDHLGALFNLLARMNFRRIGGVSLFAAAVAVCATFVLMRDSIVKQSPDLASLFQVIGFDVNLRGLEFRNLRTFTEVEDGKRVLVVEGSIRNLLNENNNVPAVRLSIRSPDLQEVYAWTVEPRTRALNGLDETRFRTILADPPEGASDIQIRFVDRGKRQIVLE